MISVVCPVYNEIGYIDKVIDFCQKAEPYEKEVFLVDGGSTDGTRERIKARIAEDPRFRLLDNPEKFVPAALNKAILMAKGDIIVRLDAHSEYAPDYFTAIIQTFAGTDADITGGSMRIAKGTRLQDAIGYATSTIFGVGDSSFHYEDFEGYTDTVYLGSWKKKIFETTGLFDEDMKRNQDDEFHYRAKSYGFKLYQSPAIKVYYHPRNSYKRLYTQYFQYGLYKPLVLKKVKSEIKIRHFIPSIFALYFLLLLLFSVSGFVVQYVPLALYLVIDLFFCFRSGKPLTTMWLIFLVYPVLHLGYGLGFLAGIPKFWRNKA